MCLAHSPSSRYEVQRLGEQLVVEGVHDQHVTVVHGDGGEEVLEISRLVSTKKNHFTKFYLTNCIERIIIVIVNKCPNVYVSVTLDSQASLTRQYMTSFSRSSRSCTFRQKRASSSSERRHLLINISYKHICYQNTSCVYNIVKLIIL